MMLMEAALTLGGVVSAGQELQVKPSPANPGSQVQTREPTVFVQVAWASQPPFSTAHSSSSTQSTPLKM